MSLRSSMATSGRTEQGRTEPSRRRVIEACDKLARYIEASHSIRLGLAPQALADGKRNLYSGSAGR
jgi:hypothetical protein